MSFLFYSTLRDFRSWEVDVNSLVITVTTSSPVSPLQLLEDNNQNKDIVNVDVDNADLELLLKPGPGDSQSTSRNPPAGAGPGPARPAPVPFLINCSSLLSEGESRENYRRDVTLGTLTVIGLCFFFWISCLYLCTQCCRVSHRITSCCAGWLNLIFALAWFTGGLATLINFLIQNSEDKKQNHEFCLLNSSSNKTTTTALNSKLRTNSGINSTKLAKCSALLCQASSAKLVSFGLSVFSCWLHVLCFIVAIEQGLKERKCRQSEIGTNPSNSPSVSLSSRSQSETSGASSVSVTKSSTSDMLLSLSRTTSSVVTTTAAFYNSSLIYNNNNKARTNLYGAAGADLDLDYDLDLDLGIGVDILGIRNLDETSRPRLLNVGAELNSSSVMNANHRKSRLKKSKNCDWNNGNFLQNPNTHKQHRSRKLVRFKGIQNQNSNNNSGMGTPRPRPQSRTGAVTGNGTGNSIRHQQQRQQMFQLPAPIPTTHFMSTNNKNKAGVEIESDNESDSSGSSGSDSSNFVSNYDDENFETN